MSEEQTTGGKVIIVTLDDRQRKWNIRKYSTRLDDDEVFMPSSVTEAKRAITIIACVDQEGRRLVAPTDEEFDVLDQCHFGELLNGN